ncbi:N,N-dimethylformamidase beta subunit family domain-containing protein [Pelagicoccus mobilis]|uniref:Twin-arginine translocation signal domain-containing protein n=1 Tax=Pelagicoccus mobilis TaxID=415221 RepID=A0A934VRF6_9BACT|nr:N,N-dimethylformamidase beta subunit family domain-containing protein [Pelagicoccus mobilis]MBK1877459.1 twin-arginine translocation signal domain-containing protein [Pelagicoccus mobilis]
MNQFNDLRGGIHRRDLIKGVTAAGLGLVAGGLSSSLAFAQSNVSSSMRRNLIQVENAKPGTRDWQLTKTRQLPGKINKNLDNGRCPWIEGYCSANSVRAGETLRIMVSTNPVSKFKLEIFRTGYYNGDGGRLMKRFDDLEGKAQADPPVGENYVRECNWDPSVEFKIPSDWLSGVYLGKLTAEKENIQSYVIFIVRDDRPCDLLFQCSDLTWSAYNRWPADFSIYTSHPGGSTTGFPSGSVSFDRPYGLFTHPVNKIKASGGSGEFLPWEFPLSFWLEQHGYDVSYISNVDTHADPKGLLRTKGFISVGHDEYWSVEMYDNVSKARDEGVNLAFLSANAVFCVVPMLPSSKGVPNRTIRREGWFNPLPPGAKLPPNMIHQKGFKPDFDRDAARLMGARTPLLAFNGSGDWTCAKPEHWLFEGTGMKAGDSIKGLVGWEMHAEPAMDLPGMEIVAKGPTMAGDKKGEYTATVYNGPKGNVVFNAATIWWANGLSSPPGHQTPVRHGVAQQGVDERVQQITHNLFQRMIKP